MSAHLRGRGRRNPAGRSLPSAEPGDCPVRGGGRHPTDRFLAAFSPRADPRRAGRGARCAPCGCSAPASLPPRSPGLRRCQPRCYPRGAARPSVGRFPVPTQQMAAPTRCRRRRKFKRLKARPGRFTGKKSAPFCQLHLGAEDVPESQPPPGAGGVRLGGGCVGAESREFVAAVRHGAGGSPGLRDVGWENGHAGLGAPPARGSAASALLSAARSGCCRGMGVALLSREWGAEGLRTHSCRAPRGKPARLRCAE